MPAKGVARLLQVSLSCIGHLSEVDALGDSKVPAMVVFPSSFECFLLSWCATSKGLRARP